LFAQSRKDATVVAGNKIRIKLKSYDHTLVDRATEKIIRSVRATGAIVRGPIPLPTERTVITVNRSPHIDKESREQFEIRNHRRLIDIVGAGQKTIDALMKLELPSGVDVEIKT
jgi:small subunit ribosomal protein S10